MKAQKPQYRRFADSQGIGVLAAPVPIETAFLGLAHQSSLPVPAKFVLAADGRAGVQAELPRALPLADARKLTREAADAALRWVEALAEAGPQLPLTAPGAAGDAGDCADLESALDQLPWSWRRGEAGAYQLYASPIPGTAVRVNAHWRDGAGLWVASETRLRIEGPKARRAVAHFALEANPRLRLARMAVEDAQDSSLRVVWDARLPGAASLSQGVVPVTEAVVYAQALTRRAVVSLRDEEIAATYLRMRGVEMPPRGRALHSRVAERDAKSIPIAHESARQPVGLEG